MTEHRRPPRLTDLAHKIIATTLVKGAIAIDATAGNGHDTVFLARQVGDGGIVHAFDIQAAALAATKARLAAAPGDPASELVHRVRFHHASHTTMAIAVPREQHGLVQAITFNLGYLPGSDHALTTTPESTRQALAAAVTLLAPEGLMTVLAYRGHAGGGDETTTVATTLDALKGRLGRLERVESPGPVLFVAYGPAASSASNEASPSR